MSKRFIYFTLFIVFLISCNKRERENPFEVAKSYCNCVEQEMNNYKDSLINLNDCGEKVYPNSRLIQIQMLFDADPAFATKNYSTKTLDSARKFSSEVSRIIDTLCFSKFDPKRVKKMPHISM